MTREEFLAMIKKKKGKKDAKGKMPMKREEMLKMMEERKKK